MLMPAGTAHSNKGTYKSVTEYLFEVPLRHYLNSITVRSIAVGFAAVGVLCQRRGHSAQRASVRSRNAPIMY